MVSFSCWKWSFAFEAQAEEEVDETEEQFMAPLAENRVQFGYKSQKSSATRKLGVPQFCSIYEYIEDHVLGSQTLTFCFWGLTYLLQ